MRVDVKSTMSPTMESLADVVQSTELAVMKATERWRKYKKTRFVRKNLVERNVDINKLYEAFSGKPEIKGISRISPIQSINGIAQAACIVWHR